MKALEFHDLQVEDRLLLSFEGAFEPGAELAHELEPFFQALEAYSDGWMPDVVEGKRRRKYTRAAIWKALEEKRHARGTSLGLYRTKWPALDLWPRVHLPPLSPSLAILLEVQPLSLFADEARCQKLVEMVRAWALRYPVSHVSAHSLADDQLAGAPGFGRDDETRRRDGFDQVYEVSWLNVFGRELVEKVGRERVLSTPAHRVEELPNGAVLVVLRPTVADFASEEAREAQARAHVHLRPELDLDTVRSALRERSARLAPVEPRFHPDVAALVERVVALEPLSERQVRIAHFNAWKPPEPEEWLPVSAALPSDVTDVAEAVDAYDDLSERLVALLHTKVPSVFDATPESLTDVDEQFWVEYFPGMFEREKIDEHAVPAIGAYLGQVLVKHLGGEWIPRRKLQEAQVRVGERVWLPFVRAWRYMRERESVLDYSLTQLYRAAARGRGRGE
ncbi:hypothetical protein [Melittangium boletus]|uniref:Uncharacterized protein n=1 Tax=Melittangium boletus DSM 14713 TaxID=1294270 RepID=A0A250IEL4_9BACT|nr:hypothetical protein [Melittangium boletus]ATB29660.1 hypothetical protein MEBOL_003115 [Melittangium boletus DSM 14713]